MSKAKINRPPKKELEKNYKGLYLESLHGHQDDIDARNDYRVLLTEDYGISQSQLDAWEDEALEERMKSRAS